MKRREDIAVADMMADMAADMEVHNEVYWPEAVWCEVYPTCVSSKLCEFIFTPFLNLPGA